MIVSTKIARKTGYSAICIPFFFYTPIVYYIPNALRTSDAYDITPAMILAYIMPTTSRE